MDAPLLLILLISVFSSASSDSNYCLCKPGVDSTSLQKTLDYACGQLGDGCNAIKENGACYSPNTIQDHCSYAVNAFYHSVPSATCDFKGTAVLSTTLQSSSTNCYSTSSSSTPQAVPSQGVGSQAGISPPFSSVGGFAPPPPGVFGGGITTGLGPSNTDLNSALLTKANKCFLYLPLVLSAMAFLRT